MADIQPPDPTAPALISFGLQPTESGPQTLESSTLSTYIYYCFLHLPGTCTTMSSHNRRPSGTSKSKPLQAGTPSSFRASSTLSGSPSRTASTARLASSPAPGQIPTPQHARSGSQSGVQTPLAGATASSVPGPGESSLSQALRGSLGQSPPRFATASQADTYRGGSPSRQAHGGEYGTPGSGQLGRSPRPNEDLEVLRRHLVGPSQAPSEPGSYRRPSNMPGIHQEEPSVADDDEFSSLQLQGGDTTRHIYRYAERREREQAESE